MDRNKGSLIYDIIDDYCVLDLETTGFDSQLNEIIEICIIKVRSGNIVDKYETLIKPENEIDEFIEELTGITNQMVQNAPIFDDIYKDIINFIEDDIVLGHNVSFDINFLYDNLIKHNYEFKNNYIDTLWISKKIIHLPNYKLETISNHFSLNVEKFHRAYNDTKTTYEIYELLKKDIKEKNIDADKLKKMHMITTTPSINDLRKVTTDVDLYDEDNIFFDKNVVFTGELKNFKRIDAAKIIVDCGGRCQNGITKDTNFLIMGNTDFIKSIKGNKTSKMKKAEELILKGYDIQIINENIFIDNLKLKKHG